MNSNSTFFFTCNMIPLYDTAGKDVTFEDCHFGIKYSLHCIKYINKIFVFCTVFEVQRIFTSAEVHLKSKQGKTDHFPCALRGP